MSPTPLRPRMPRAPTARQIRFCEEYARDPNAYRAALRAGFSKSFARGHSHTLLRDPKVLRQLAATPDANYPELDTAIAELGRIAYANVVDVLRLGPDGRLDLDPARMDRRQMAGVRELVVDETVEKATGNLRRTVRVRMADRKDALMKLIAALKLRDQAYDLAYNEACARYPEWAARDRAEAEEDEKKDGA